MHLTVFTLKTSIKRLRHPVHPSQRRPTLLPNLKTSGLPSFQYNHKNVLGENSLKVQKLLNTSDHATSNTISNREGTRKIVQIASDQNNLSNPSPLVLQKQSDLSHVVNRSAAPLLPSDVNTLSKFPKILKRFNHKQQSIHAHENQTSTHSSTQPTNPRPQTQAPLHLNPHIYQTDSLHPNSKSKSDFAAANASKPTSVDIQPDNLISELKSQALQFSQENIQSDILKAAKESLQYYPGVEKRLRLEELTQCHYTLESLLTEAPSIDNCNYFLRSVAHQSGLKKTLQMFDKIINHGISLNLETFVSLLYACTVARDAKTARLLYLKMRSLCLTPNEKVYGSLIKAHVAASEIQSAFALLRKMEDEGFQANTIIYTTLIDGLVKTNRIRKAWYTFWNARTWKGIEPDEVLFTVMIKACAKRKEAERALNLLDDMRSLSLKPTDITYTELIHACCHRNEFFHKCFDFYHQMDAEGMPITYQVCKYLLRACQSSANVKRSKQVVKLMGQLGIQLTTDTCNTFLMTIAYAMQFPKISLEERKSNMLTAIQFLKQMRQVPIAISTQSLNAVLLIYAKAGYCEHAIEMLQQYAVFKCCPDSKTYLILLTMTSIDMKDPGRFFAMWDHMRKNAATIHPSHSMMELCLKTAIQSNSMHRVIDTLEEMYQLKIFPSVAMTEQLWKTAKNVHRVHELMTCMAETQKQIAYKSAEKRHNLQQVRIDERDIELAMAGSTTNTVTPEQEVRKIFFSRKEAAERRQQRNGKRKWLNFEDYKQIRDKGGPLYASLHDRMRPTPIL